MSQNLYFRKVVPKDGEVLSTGLKWAVQKHYGYGPTIVTRSDILFFQGVVASSERDSETVRSCNQIINAINESDDGVEIWIAD